MKGTMCSSQSLEFIKVIQCDGGGESSDHGLSKNDIVGELRWSDINRDPGRMLAWLRQDITGKREGGSDLTGGRSCMSGDGLPMLDAELIENGLHGMPFLNGAEHHVFFDPISNRVTKLTRPGEYGAEERGLEGYLRRLQWSNELFEDDFKIEGKVILAGEHAPRVVTAQPWYRANEKRPHPTIEEIDFYMRKKGFLKAYDGAFVHESRDIIASDALPKNFIRDADGHTHPIDVILIEPNARQYERLQSQAYNHPQVKII